MCTESVTYKFCLQELQAAPLINSITSPSWAPSKLLESFRGSTAANGTAGVWVCAFSTGLVPGYKTRCSWYYVWTPFLPPLGRMTISIGWPLPSLCGISVLGAVVLTCHQDLLNNFNTASWIDNLWHQENSAEEPGLAGSSQAVPLVHQSSCWCLPVLSRTKRHGPPDSSGTSSHPHAAAPVTEESQSP